MPETGQTDDVLVALARNGDMTAYDTLRKKYLNYAKKLGKDIMEQYPGSGFTLEDFEADGLISFIDAYTHYTPECGNFYPYWKRVSTHLMLRDMHQRSYNYGARGFKGPFSFDESVKNNPSLLMDEVIGLDDPQIKNFENRDRLNKLHDGINESKFTPIQKEVLKLYLQEYKVSEIATILDIPYKRAYSILISVKRKIGIAEKSEK
ncbi:MAG: hypothetical protein LUD22_03575 [Coprobacillus sp.]|nr:hypothetical protein [Coprobacillus sp.]